MKTLLKSTLVTALLAGSASVLAADIHPLRSEGWKCQTAPIWNGRTSYPRYATGATRDEAWQRAAAYCATSGYAEYCRSQIACWEEG